MFKPIRWKTFPRDFLRIQIGFTIFGFSIAMLIRGNLGTGAWAVLQVGMADILKVTPGTMAVATGIVVLSGALILREKIGWGTLANILSIGPWMDLYLLYIPSVEDNLFLQSMMLLTGIFFMGLASAIYIGVDAGAGPRDSLMLAINRTTGVSVRLARTIIEVTVFIIGWLVGGPAGVGTIVFALLVGPAVQLWFRILKVEPHGHHLEET
jgi:uncharacterized membrane protein YczE